MPDPIASIRFARDHVRRTIAALQREDEALTRVIEQLEAGQENQLELPMDEALVLAEPITAEDLVPALKRTWTGWSEEEHAVLRLYYPEGGTKACVPLLQNRKPHSIRVMAARLGLFTSVRGGRPRMTPREPAPAPEADSPVAERTITVAPVAPEPVPEHRLPQRPVKRVRTFEEQLALVESGQAGIVAAVRIRRA
jgi:hypothetical protein